jgi:hypothetical protein
MSWPAHAFLRPRRSHQSITFRTPNPSTHRHYQFTFGNHSEVLTIFIFIVRYSPSPIRRIGKGKPAHFAECHAPVRPSLCTALTTLFRTLLQTDLPQVISKWTRFLSIWMSTGIGISWFLRAREIFQGAEKGKREIYMHENGFCLCREDFPRRASLNAAQFRHVGSTASTMPG